jgi:deoxyribose-phosphate aldolase
VRTRPDDPLLNAGAARVGHATEGAGVHGACGTLAQYIDHTLLKPTATDEQVREVCEQATKYHFASVCINPAFVPLAASMLKGSGVKVCTVIGFPLGSSTSETKAFETRDAVAKGADEIDMVINIGKLKSGDFEFVCNDIRTVVQSSNGRVVKVIIETSVLTDDEKVAACILSKAAGADFVKTSTGFGGGGATPEDVALMRKTVGSELGVKASGGVRDCEGAEKLIAAGASRLGASASVSIVEGRKSNASY